MKDVINTITAGGAGTTATGAATGQIIIALIGLVLMAVFGSWGAYLKYRDTKILEKNSAAIHDALARGDIAKAISIRG